VKGKEKHAPRKYATAFRLGQHIYYNAARLCSDACTLYSAEAFPSAYALAILGHEELGKLQMIDHVVTEAVLNKGTFRLDGEWMSHLFSHTMFYSHHNKQAWGSHKGTLNGTTPLVERLVDSNRLDFHKQDALYVGFFRGRIQRPDRFRASHAFRQITYLFRGLERVADLPFTALLKNSTRASRRFSERTLTPLRHALSQLRPPARRKKLSNKPRNVEDL
jgi:AbiV family abortive infection protein